MEKAIYRKRKLGIYTTYCRDAGEHNESKIFEACQDAIDEKKLVRDLHTTFSGAMYS